NFEQATNDISGCKYSTIGLVIPFYSSLLDEIDKYIKNYSNTIIEEAAKKAKTKLEKYYSDAEDPRLKLEYYAENELDDYIESYKKRIKELWKSEYQPTQNSISKNNQQKKVATIFKKCKIVYSDELDIYLRNPTIDPFIYDDILLCSVPVDFKTTNNIGEELAIESDKTTELIIEIELGDEQGLQFW
ncbi:17775_t:CDS:2, partial [Racocetra fulgida]